MHKDQAECLAWPIGGSSQQLDERIESVLMKLAGSWQTAMAPSPDRDALLSLFRAQAQSRHLDFAARWLQSKGAGFYTIGSAGHEANAALGMLSKVTDPALLHYRSGGFYAARAARHGANDPIRDVLLGMTAASSDPISGGRHKVFGHPDLHVIPQTSTIASHLPRAVGLGFALGLASRLGSKTPWPEDAVVICSFGDASANHSTATGSLNAAAYLAHRAIDCPVIFVCEDNGIGISTPSPAGWPEASLRTVPGVPYYQATGTDPSGLISTVSSALETVRRTRNSAILHLKTVRYLGHAGSDVESAYRHTGRIQSEYTLDPLLHTAQKIVAEGIATGQELVTMYTGLREEVMRSAETVLSADRLTERATVMRPLQFEAPPMFKNSRGSRRPPVTLAQSINHALSAVLDEYPQALLFGEDVARKGGVYGVTRGLQKRFGGNRVFDTILDEQTVLGTALGTSLAGFLPIPEIQYLAYLHNAEDQLRGEAASLPFFSDGQYRNGMVVRVAGLAYQKGFGGHFHNDNSLAVLRDIPGIILAVPSSPSDASGMLRSCIDLAREQGRVCVFVEPIALYHTKDLLEGDRGWLEPVDASARTPLDEVAVFGEGADLTILTFGNGTYMSRRVSTRFAELGISCRVVDLRWLLPLPERAIEREVLEAKRILIVDETRASAGIADALVAITARSRPGIRLDAVTSADSFIPLGPAAATVLVDEEEILRRGLLLIQDE